MYEHRWEKKTNTAIIIGIVITIIFYYYKINFTIPFVDFYVSAVEVGIFSLVVVGICHLIARLGHKGEQHFFKKNRSWRN